MKKALVKTSSIILVGHLTSQLIRLGGNLVTTRLLAPEAFGIMALVHSIIAIIHLFGELGLTQSVVQNKHGENPDFLKTVYTLKVVVGLILSSFILIFAGVIFFLQSSLSFDESSIWVMQELPVVMAGLCIVSLLNAFSSVNLSLFVRWQKPVRPLIFTLVSQVIGIMVAITYAIYSPTVYAMMFSGIATAISFCLLTHTFLGKNMSGFAFKGAFFNDIVSYGKWLTGSTLITGISKNIDKTVLSFILTAEHLGVYAIANMLFLAIQAVLKKLDSPLFVALSETYREARDRLMQRYYKIRLYRDLIYSASAAFLFIFGNFIVQILFDERYLDAGFYLKILSLIILFDCFSFKSNLHLASGNSKIFLTLALQRFLSIFILCPPLYFLFGVPGLLVALSMRALAGLPNLYIQTSRMIKIDYVKELFPVVFFSISFAFFYALLVVIERFI